MMINFSIDASKRLVDVQVLGFLTVKQVEDHEVAFAAKLAAIGLRSGFYRIVDTSKAAIQTPEVLEALAAMEARIKPDRQAIVTGTAASRIQVRRTTAHPTSFEKRMFATREEAIDWLLEDRAMHRANEAEFSIQKAA